MSFVLILNGLATQSLASGSNAQETSQQQPDPKQLFQACRELAAEVDFLRKKVAGLEKLDSEKDSLIVVLEQRIMLLEKSIESLKKSLELSGSIGQVDQKIIKSFETSLKAAQDEVTRQTRKASLWRKVSGFGITGAFILGAVVGIILGR